MGNLTRFCVVGSRVMNNYYIVYTYLKQYIPKDAIIVTGGAKGVDMLAEVYAEMNGHPCEVYEAQWDRFGKEAGMIRNIEMIRNSDHVIAFWDGSSPGTKQMIEESRKRNRNVVVVDVSEEDVIKPHPGRVVHVNKEEFDIYIGRPYHSYVGTLGNPFKIDANHDRYKVIAMFTDYLLKNVEMMREVVKLKDQKSSIDGGPVKLGCWCADGTENGPLCHGDMICWLLDHAYGEIKSLAHLDSESSDPCRKCECPEKPKTCTLTQEQILSKWSENGESVQVYTPLGLSLAKGYKTIVQDDWKRWYLEVTDFDIIRNHIHMSLSEYDKVDQDPPRVYFKSNDRTKTIVIQQLTEFDGSPFKKGCWYIKIDPELNKG